MSEPYRTYRVVRRTERSRTVSTLALLPEEGARPDFIPGQFVDVLLPAFGADAKSYTISSTPREPKIEISIRVAGNFSRALAQLREGESIRVSEPYGYFYPIDSGTPRICVAGGIGVTPFVSFVRDSIENGIAAPTLLLYSSRTADEAVFASDFAKLSAAHPHFSIRNFVTREQGTLPGAAYGRIGTKDLAEANERLPQAHIFLCGSIEFVRDMRLSLKSLLVPEERIFTESFY